MTATTALAGADVELDPGQVVRVLAHEGALVRVRAGQALEGTVPASALRDPAASER
ncbi:MAG: hypothetical protein IPJ04_11285 [Candidatus Eisenbacteria bacterium]|nr:hypothetical protein [Candidatus Eisenbacteria bacterium]